MGQSGDSDRVPLDIHTSVFPQVKGFSTVNDSFLSALRILMRDFDFQTLQHLDQTFVTFFFVLFTCVVIFVLLVSFVGSSTVNTVPPTRWSAIINLSFALCFTYSKRRYLLSGSSIELFF